jgi:hypothetical protein
MIDIEGIVRARRKKFIKETRRICGKNACIKLDCKDCRDIFSEHCRLATGFWWESGKKDA